MPEKAIIEVTPELRDALNAAAGHDLGYYDFDTVDVRPAVDKYYPRVVVLPTARPLRPSQRTPDGSRP